MPIPGAVEKVLPNFMVELLRKTFSRPSRSRKESNKWLRHHCKDIQGNVISIGTDKDLDREGDYYRNYFLMASSYTTSEASGQFNCDLTLDVRSMPQIKDESYDCIFCSGVLEHVDDYQAGLDEMTRILKIGGFLLLGLPFRQALHMSPQDFWRFTAYGIKHLLKNSYEILDIEPMDAKRGKEFPAAYWVKAKRIRRI